MSTIFLEIFLKWIIYTERILFQIDIVFNDYI